MHNHNHITTNNHTSDLLSHSTHFSSPLLSSVASSHSLSAQLAEMKIELHAIANKSKKDDYILKMQTYQKLIAKHKKTLLTQSTSSLNGTRPAVSATEKNQQSLDVLKQAHAQLAQTEEVGIGVLSNLAKQKETIKNTQANLRDVNGNLTYSNKLLNRMGKWWRG